MLAMTIEPTKNILLTGAGFTKNFGGYLASEMWAAIFNHPDIQKSNSLRSIFRGHFDYEWLYDHVVFSATGGPPYTDPEKAALTNAINNAYKHMHKIICRDELEHLNNALSLCESFLQRFAGPSGSRGFLFTLNQDLFLERFYSNKIDPYAIGIPGLIGCNPRWFSGELASELTHSDFVKLPDKSEVDKMKSRFWNDRGPSLAYVKLHGSYGWRSMSHSDVMVIGHAKAELIRGEPLLDWFLHLFEEALLRPNRRLVVIGYGFGDDHINSIIVNAIVRYALRVYVISPEEPKQFKQMLQLLDNKTVQIGESPLAMGSNLWFGVGGYYQDKLTDFYSKLNRQLTAKGEEFFRNLELA